MRRNQFLIQSVIEETQIASRDSGDSKVDVGMCAGLIRALTADARQSDVAKCLARGNDELSKLIDKAPRKKVAALTEGDNA